MGKLQETKGLIFRSIKYSETSLILDIYTRDYGLKSFIVSGVRSSQGKSKANYFQVMNYLNLIFYDNAKDKLSRIKSFHYAKVYNRIGLEFGRSSIGIFILEVTRNCIKEMESNHLLFDFLIESFHSLDNMQNEELIHFTFNYLLNLTKFLGFYPLNNYSKSKKFFDLLHGTFASEDIDTKHTLNEDDSKVFLKLLSNNFSEIEKSERNQLLSNLLLYYSVHLENFRDIKSLEIYRQVLNL